eukprot:8401380-Ditylum_brightwellii.AAC.1
MRLIGIIWHTLALTKLKSELLKMKTALIIHQVIYYKVAQWCNLLCGMPPCIPRDATGVILSDAVKTQGYLSLDNFMKGRIAKEWYQAQA